MGITLPTLVEHYVTTRQIKGCSKKTLTGIRSNLGKFIKFLQSRGHSLKLADLTLEDARSYVASLQGPVTKYEGHKFNRPLPNSTFAPDTVHTYVRILRAWRVSILPHRSRTVDSLRLLLASRTACHRRGILDFV